MGEREIGELTGEIKSVVKTVDHLQILAERNLTATSANTGLIQVVIKNMDRQDKRLTEIELELVRQGQRLRDVEDDLEKHIAADVPVQELVGKWSVRVIWGLLTAVGGLIVAYIYKIFGVK